MTDHLTRVERREVVQPEPALALARLLEVDEPDLERDGVPLLWHWLYLVERPGQSDLGTDGHPVRGVVPAPPEPGRRRMWAGGRVKATAPLRLGQETLRCSEIVSSVDKEGRSGRLTLVVVRHTYSQGGTVCVQEEQDIVYRDAVVAAGATSAEPEVTAVDAVPPGSWVVPIDPTLLFRFSALTYNAHRIHYDREYAREVEGYTGLVVHGPLQAIAMAEAVRATGATVRSMDFRLVSPLIDHQGMVVTSEPEQEARWDVSVQDRTGRMTARGRVTGSET